MEYIETLSKARTALDTGFYDLVLEYLLPVLPSMDRDGSKFRGRAYHYALLALFQKDEHRALVNLSERALAADPLEPAFYLLRFGSYSELGMIQQARKEIEDALILVPDEPTYHHLHSVALYDEERFHEAMEATEQALSFDPLDPESHLQYARVLQALGRGDDALDALETASELAPDMPEIAQMQEALEQEGSDRMVWLQEAVEVELEQSWKDKLRLPESLRQYTRPVLISIALAGMFGMGAYLF